MTFKVQLPGILHSFASSLSFLETTLTLPVYILIKKPMKQPCSSLFAVHCHAMFKRSAVFLRHSLIQKDIENAILHHLLADVSQCSGNQLFFMHSLCLSEMLIRRQHKSIFSGVLPSPRNVDLRTISRICMPLISEAPLSGRNQTGCMHATVGSNFHCLFGFETHQLEPRCLLRSPTLSPHHYPNRLQGFFKRTPL